MYNIGFEWKKNIKHGLTYKKFSVAFSAFNQAECQQICESIEIESNLIQYSQKNDWFFHKLFKHIRALNKSSYQYELIGLGEHLKAFSEASELCQWHQHLGEGEACCAKLSFIMTLTAIQRKNGYWLEFMGWHENNSEQQVFREITVGSIVVFPAYQMRKINLLQENNEKIIVGCFYGNPFR